MVYLEKKNVSFPFPHIFVHDLPPACMSIPCEGCGDVMCCGVGVVGEGGPRGWWGVGLPSTGRDVITSLGCCLPPGGCVAVVVVVVAAVVVEDVLGGVAGVAGVAGGAVLTSVMVLLLWLMGAEVGGGEMLTCLHNH